MTRSVAPLRMARFAGRSGAAATAAHSILGRLLLSAALAGFLIAPGVIRPATVSAGVCSGWTNVGTPPPTIRVYRVSRGVVQNVDFKTYVKVVVAAEWPATWPFQTLRAGAVAAKQYAWYYAMHYRGGTGADGNCYDVRDDSVDQLYGPESRTPTEAEETAVDTTWPEAVLRNGTLILTGYRPGNDVPCGQDADGSHLIQQSSRRCGLNSQTGEQILHIYYDPMTLAGAPAPPGPPTSVLAVPLTSAAQVSWTAPVTDPYPITGYSVTSSPGGKTCTSLVATCVVRGLTNGTSYTFTVTASNYAGTGAASAPSNGAVPQPSTYYPITPTRLLDSRTGPGFTGVLYSRCPRTFVVTGGAIPDDATAVTGNLTVTNQSSQGWLYVGPEPLGNPGSSTLNFPSGDDRANNVTVALGSTTVDGVAKGSLSVTFVAPGSGTTHAVFDVTGYYRADRNQATHGATYHPLDPARILDTRTGVGVAGAFTSSQPRAFQVRGAGLVPANATAVTGNLTVSCAGYRGWLYVGPDSTPTPSSSNLNFPAGENRANGVTALLDAQGKLSVTLVTQVPATASVIFDVTGYFTADLTGSVYIPLAPARVLDTRIGVGLGGPFSSHAARTLAVAGTGGVDPAAVGVTGNLTVVNETSQGWLYVGPRPLASPLSSTLNFPLGDIRANGVTVSFDSGNLGITFVAPTNGPTTDVLFDVSGYFTK